MQEVESIQGHGKEFIPPPAASASLSEKISLTFETKRLINEIEREIAQLDWEISDLAPYDAAPRLAGPARHLLASGGKRIRPLLVCLLSRALHVPFDGKLQVCALAAELVHTATLLHDDILDGARTRRGRITAHLKYDAHTAILSGDALLCKAMSDVAKIGDAECFVHLALTLRELVEGECLQADLVGKVHEELDTVLEVCRRKTGSLFAWCGWVAGHLADKHSEELRKFGKHLGLSFQLLDDVLDWESDATGKPKLQDLREAKLNTVAVILCLKSLQARTRLKEAFAQLDENMEVRGIERLHQDLIACPEFPEAIAWVKSQAEKESAFALANLEVLADSSWKELAKKVTVDLLKRMK